MSFKNFEGRFNGDASQCWMEYVDEYKQVTSDYSLNAELWLQCIQDIMCKDAQKYFVDLVKHYAKSFKMAAEMVNKR